jgi:hypothetical protein
MRARTIGGAISLVAVLCTSVTGDDKWDLGQFTDDAPPVINQLTHGAIQTHDIQGPAGPTSDQDFSFVAAKAGHSYEVRVFSTNTCFQVNANENCATLARVAPDGATILNAATGPDGAMALGFGWMVVRWTSSADQLDLIRVNGYALFPAEASSQYDIQMRDTTYLVPRWNNTATQVTVFLIQNGSAFPITGSILLYNAAGALSHTQPLAVPARGLQVFSTASIPALAGGSGSAAIVHDGTYGALAGKAVALEPGTGFTFDTPITPIPY